MTISYQPMYVGATDPVWDIPLTTDAGADDITGFDMTKFSLVFSPTSGGDSTGTGTFTLKSASPAEVYYQPSDLDVSKAFTGFLFPKAIAPDGRHRVWDPIGGDPNNPATPFAIKAS